MFTSTSLLPLLDYGLQHQTFRFLSDPELPQVSATSFSQQPLIANEPQQFDSSTNQILTHLETDLLKWLCLCNLGTYRVESSVLLLHCYVFLLVCWRYHYWAIAQQRLFCIWLFRSTALHLDHMPCHYMRNCILDVSRNNV
jgi:hypothetical protein